MSTMFSDHKVGTQICKQFTTYQDRSQMSKPRYLFQKHKLFLNAGTAAPIVFKEIEYMCLPFSSKTPDLAVLDYFIQLAFPAVYNILCLFLAWKSYPFFKD